MKPIRRIPAFALAAIAASLAAGCASAPSKPQSMLDPQANFGAYRTFALPEAGGGAQGQTVSIVDGYIRNAITNEMTPRNTDLLAACRRV